MDKWPAYARLSTVAPAGHLPTASQHPQTPSRGALSSPRGVAIAREMGGAVASDLTIDASPILVARASQCTRIRRNDHWRQSRQFAQQLLQTFKRRLIDSRHHRERHRQASSPIKHPHRQLDPTPGCRTVHTTPQCAGSPLVDDLMNMDRQTKPGMPRVENLSALGHMGVLSSRSTTRSGHTRRCVVERRPRSRCRRARLRQDRCAPASPVACGQA